MNSWHHLALRLLKPPLPVKVLLTLASSALLVCAFTVFDPASPLTYASYALSAHTLVVDAMGVPPALRRAKEGLYRNQYAARYMTELELRAMVALYLGVGFNLLYAAFKIITGVLYGSPWFAAIGIYYGLLCLIRFTLLRRAQAADKQKEPERRKRFELKSYRQCGFLLLALTSAMSGMTFQMIWQNKNYEYPGFVIYASAAYAFYRLTMAIINLSRFEKRRSPVLTAAKTMDLAAALMAIFALQTAMFSQFGGNDELTRRTMNLLTGSFVCLAGVGLAVFMIVRANRELRRPQATQYLGE